MGSRRLLGIDFGEKRIGIAVSEGLIAVPLLIVDHEGREADLVRIADIARAQEASEIVVGLPLMSSGDVGEQARRCRRFGEALARRVDAPVVYHDETLSSVTASASARELTVAGRSRRKTRIDDLAAVTILQSYIDDHRERL